MDSRSTNKAGRPAADRSRRRFALAAGLGLLVMAIVAPIAQFGVLQKLVVPTDAAATVNNIVASSGAFWAAIGALLLVVMLDVVVAWGAYGLLRSADERLARLVAGLRVIYAALFALVLINLVDVAQAVGGASAAAVQSDELRGQVATSLASFTHGWDLALGIFGLHLVGLGVLLIRFAAPRLLAGLVVVAGIGYLADTIGSIVVADYSMKISTFTFVGEALLIFWLLWIGIKGVRSFASPQTAVPAPVQSSEAVAS